jgi:hypothetical protein
VNTNRAFVHSLCRIALFEATSIERSQSPLLSRLFIAKINLCCTAADAGVPLFNSPCSYSCGVLEGIVCCAVEKTTLFYFKPYTTMRPDIPCFGQIGELMPAATAIR